MRMMELSDKVYKPPPRPNKNRSSISSKKNKNFSSPSNVSLENKSNKLAIDSDKQSNSTYDAQKINKIQTWWRNKLFFLFRLKILQRNIREFLKRKKNKLNNQNENNKLTIPIQAEESNIAISKNKKGILECEKETVDKCQENLKKKIMNKEKSLHEEPPRFYREKDAIDEPEKFEEILDLSNQKLQEEGAEVFETLNLNEDVKKGKEAENKKPLACFDKIENKKNSNRVYVNNETPDIFFRGIGNKKAKKLVYLYYMENFNGFYKKFDDSNNNSEEEENKKDCNYIKNASAQTPLKNREAKANNNNNNNEFHKLNDFSLWHDCPVPFKGNLLLREILAYESDDNLKIKKIPQSKISNHNAKSQSPHKFKGKNREISLGNKLNSNRDKNNEIAIKETNSESKENTNDSESTIIIFKKRPTQTDYYFTDYSIKQEKSEHGTKDEYKKIWHDSPVPFQGNLHIRKILKKDNTYGDGDKPRDFKRKNKCRNNKAEKNNEEEDEDDKAAKDNKCCSIM